MADKIIIYHVGMPSVKTSTKHSCKTLKGITLSQLLRLCLPCLTGNRRIDNRRDGVVVRASASQSVDLGFISLVESYQKTLKNGIYSFPAWCSAFIGGCGEQADKFACCVLGQGT